MKFAAILPVALFLSIPDLRAISAPLRAEFVYVANEGNNTVSGYTINPATGALTAIAGSPFAAGEAPQSVAVDSGGKFACAVNEADGSVSAYSIGPSGALTPVSGSPFPGGEAPHSVVVDPSGKFAYVVNAGSDTGNVSGYTINPATGALTAIAGSPFAAGVVPLSVAVDPSGKFAYVVNADSFNVSGYTINPATGALMPIPGVALHCGRQFLAGGRHGRPERQVCLRDRSRSFWVHDRLRHRGAHSHRWFALRLPCDRYTRFRGGGPEQQDTGTNYGRVLTLDNGFWARP